MQIIKTVYPNKAYSLHLAADEKTKEISGTLKTYGGMSLYLKNITGKIFATWDDAVKHYEDVYKSMNLQPPTTNDLVVELAHAGSDIYIERQKDGSYGIGRYKYGTVDVMMESKTLKSAISKAEKLIELLNTEDEE